MPESRGGGVISIWRDTTRYSIVKPKEGRTIARRERVFIFAVVGYDDTIGQRDVSGC